ncbi:hypothetical protein SADUNF_Sadunf04G0019800 [Salix dunnii]|uniref:Pectinesterase n=1 Tax=Salix dunnii TaxID=1413687 RepID=A0A835N3U6_9ROSI|nr:hypothetical protein SADUNF_Sadunf04G0019800 [Salix dunnii]
MESNYPVCYQLALSARIYGDKSALYDCAFLGVQDTLWDANGRHHFSHCYIEGSAVLYRVLANHFMRNSVTAQAEFPSDTHGFVFYRSLLCCWSKPYFGRLAEDIQQGNITYAEANCKGQGANTSKCSRWEKKLTIQQLSRFSKSSLIDQDHGWLAKLPL